MKQTTSKQQRPRKRSNRQLNISWVAVLILVVVVGFVVLATSNMLNAIPLLLIPFFVSDLSAPPVVLFNVAFIALIVGAVYRLWARKQPIRSIRVAILIVTSIAALILALFLTKFTVPLYQQYQVAHIPIAMKTFLDNTYHEPFAVVDAHYQEVRILGDAKGVGAIAYPLSQPSHRFAISQDHDGGFRERYIDLYGEKVEEIITTQLTTDLKREFNTRVTLDYVSVQKSDVELFIGEISSSKSISLIMLESFQAKKWQEYKPIIERVTTLLNKEPYSFYQYSIQITPTDDADAQGFYCNFLPHQRSKGEFEKRLNYCIAEHNSIKGREKIKQ